MKIYYYDHALTMIRKNNGFLCHIVKGTKMRHETGLLYKWIKQSTYNDYAQKNPQKEKSGHQWHQLGCSLDEWVPSKNWLVEPLIWSVILC